MAFYRVTFSSFTSLFFCLYIILFSILPISCFIHSFLFVRSLLILSSYHFCTHFHLYVDLPQLYHTVPEPALDTSLKYPCHLSLYLFTPSSLSPLLSIYVSLLFYLFIFSATITPFHYPVIFFFLAIFCSLPSFISALLALMSVAMARSIQDGVFVLSAERKMNVAAMHHSLPCVWGCVGVRHQCLVGMCARLQLTMLSFEWPYYFNGDTRGSDQFTELENLKSLMIRGENIEVKLKSLCPKLK